MILSSDISILALYQYFLCITLVGFIFSLIIPQGLRRTLLGSHGRRYARAYLPAENIYKRRNRVEEPNRDHYVTLKDININTSDTICFATAADNEDLSPLGEWFCKDMICYSYNLRDVCLTPMM